MQYNEQEIRSTYPCRSHSRNVHMNMVGVVVLASPPRDPIRSDPSATMGGASERCTRTAHQCLLLLGPARHGGVVDGISSTMAWCLWWRVYAGRALPTHARWKKIGKRLVKLGLEERQQTHGSWTNSSVRKGLRVLILLLYPDRIHLGVRAKLSINQIDVWQRRGMAPHEASADPASQQSSCSSARPRREAPEAQAGGAIFGPRRGLAGPAA
jgi:hypothetical protein